MSNHYNTPREAIINSSPEKLLFTTCARYKSDKPDYLATIDVDPNSTTYRQVISRTHLHHAADEIHHSGWNTCTSCPHKRRTHLILPCLHTSRIYIVDVTTDPRNPVIDHVVEPDEMSAHNVSFPHTSHCTPDGNVLVSCLGDADGKPQGAFVVLDGKSWQIMRQWSTDHATFGYDYWYQPAHNVMVSSEWGAPSAIRSGLNLDHVRDGLYGHTLHVWNWNEKTYLRSIKLDPQDGLMPLEVRFMHDPASVDGFVGTGLGSSIYHFYRTNTGLWTADKIISVLPKKVTGWALPEMPAVITDILLSMDDRFLYFSCWIHGDLRQYDISDPFNPKLTGQIFLGGSITTGSGVTVTSDKELSKQPEPCVIQGRKVDGGPQMLQLSLDGKRLYVTTSLYSAWDNQFYPDMIKNGAVMLLVDVDTKNGGLQLNADFLVDFGKEPDGPILAHEMRYPGGDCSSDIFTLGKHFQKASI